eukprot:6021014-Pyramimonas_sp.AAC.2
MKPTTARWRNYNRTDASEAAKRAVVVTRGGLLTEAEIKANPVQVGQALHAELKIWLDNEGHISQAPRTS